MKYLVTILLLTLGFAYHVQAQGTVHLKMVVTDDSLFFKHNKKYQIHNEYETDLKATKSWQMLILKLYADGYVTASVDSMDGDKFNKTAYLFIGKRYEWLDLRPGNVNPVVLSQVGFKEKQYRNKYFKYTELDGLLKDMLAYSENNGYPFATVKLDSVKIEDGMVSASLNLTRNQVITYDTVAIHGNATIKKPYLYAYLGIRPGKLYNETDIQRISKRLADLSFLQEERPFEIVFHGNKAMVNLFLTNKRASQFDFLLGFLPNSASTGKFLFTGNVNLNLVNPFGLGHVIGLTWQKLQPGTQDLKVNFEYPYLLSTPIGVDANFHLYKRDTSYIDIDYQVGIQYVFGGRNHLRVFVHNTITNLLNVDTNAILNTRKLPASNDVRSNLYGVEYYLEKFNYRFNPQSGYSVRITPAVGTRKIKENTTITKLADPENPGQTFASLYDTIKLNTIKYQVSYSLENFWPIGKRNTIRTATQGAAILGNKNLFQNELFRIGGNKVLRGFDEESIFASIYNVGTVEYRFLLQKNSFFNVFFDAAYVESRIQGKYRNDFPFGFGVGFSYETKAGVFGISYALGQQKDFPVNFKSGKIHFGYVNYF